MVSELTEAGRQAEALPLSEEAVRLYRELAAVNPDVYRRNLAHTLVNYAVQLGGAGQRAEALPVSEESVALYRELAAANPDAYLSDLAASLNNYAVQLTDVGRWAEALPIWRRPSGCAGSWPRSTPTPTCPT